jgi:hypothetical protein
MSAMHPAEKRLAFALAVPALIVTLAVCAVEMWRVLAPSQALIGHQTYGSPGEAIAMNDLRGAYDFIRRGQDPNVPIAVQDPLLTGGQEVLVPPIIWAAAAGRSSIVLMLLGSGPLYERDTHRAACVADLQGFSDIAADVRRFTNRPLASPCPAIPPGPPLAPSATP